MIAGAEHGLAAEPPSAAGGLVLEVVHHVRPPVHVEVACVQKLAKHVFPRDYPAACAIGRALVRGKSMTKVVPFPTSLATLMRPPSCSTILREIARPSPRPRRLVVTKSSKTAWRRSGGIPQPVS